ncbi:MAG: hypothetical protein IBX62_05915 [Coriobacteriia bacterium]|nr:hypothetical protein [Coriobacteriia bacterium]
MALTVMAVSVVMAIFAPSAFGATKSFYTYRGSVLLWTKANTTFSYDGTRVTNGSTTQSCGYVFPNLARNQGVTLYKYSSSKWRYQARFGWGAGVVTPWGDVTVYWQTSTHTHYVYGSGAYSGSSSLN